MGARSPTFLMNRGGEQFTSSLIPVQAGAFRFRPPPISPANPHGQGTVRSFFIERS
jgi:hypothetical protein